MSDTRPPSGIRRTILIDVDIPFTRLVVILIKFALASIPAAIIASLIVTVVLLAFAGLFGPNFMQMMTGGHSGGF